MFFKAAEQGHAKAQFHIGEIYEKGQGFPRNLNEAAVWYRKAAEQGNVDARTALASLLPLIATPIVSTLPSSSGKKEIKVSSEQQIISSTFDEEPIAEKIWHFDSALKASHAPLQNGYCLITAGKKDSDKVMGAYQLGPVHGYDVVGIQIIYNPTQNRLFFSLLENLQQRHSNPAFNSKWHLQNDSEWRAQVDALYKKVTDPYVDPDFPNVKLCLGWHGTDPKVIPSICSTGFANLAKTDAGWYGKGLYAALEASYSFDTYTDRSGQGLLLGWGVSFSAYPVIHGDRKELEGSPNFENYDAHVVPVNEFGGACKPGETPVHTELVYFNNQFTPRYILELRKSSPGASLPGASPGRSAMLYAYMSAAWNTLKGKPGKDGEKKHIVGAAKV